MLQYLDALHVYTYVYGTVYRQIHNVTMRCLVTMTRWCNVISASYVGVANSFPPGNKWTICLKSIEHFVIAHFFSVHIKGRQRKRGRAMNLSTQYHWEKGKKKKRNLTERIINIQIKLIRHAWVKIGSGRTSKAKLRGCVCARRSLSDRGTFPSMPRERLWRQRWGRGRAGEWHIQWGREALGASQIKLLTKLSWVNSVLQCLPQLPA